MKIPLFPLDVVLFPGIPLPLHIFEPRYQEMIAECIAGDVAFGVVRAQREGLAVIGCTARWSGLQHYPDGRSDILTQGVDRFEIEQLDDSRAFCKPRSTFFPMRVRLQHAPVREECVALHFEALELLGVTETNMNLNLDAPLAYLLAASMPADLNFHQGLLAMRSDAERTETLVIYYRAMLPKLRRGRQASERASTNGHIM